MDFSFRDNSCDKFEKKSSYYKELDETNDDLEVTYLEQIGVIQHTFKCLFQTTIEVIDDLTAITETNKYVFMMNPFYSKITVESAKRDKVLRDIAERVMNFIFTLEIEESTVIMAFIYIDSLIRQDKQLININSLENILLISLTLAYKFNQDILYSDKIICNLAFFKTIKLINMSNFYLKKINYKLFVKEEKYENYKKYSNKVNLKQFMI